jgi:hypothetical protein
VCAESGEAADQVELGQGGPVAARETLGGCGEPVSGEGRDALVQELLRGPVPMVSGGVEGEGERGCPVVEAGSRPGGECVSGRCGQPVVRLLPPGAARGGAFDVQERDPDGAAAE